MRGERRGGRRWKEIATGAGILLSAGFPAASARAEAGSTDLSAYGPSDPAVTAAFLLAVLLLGLLLIREWSRRRKAEARLENFAAEASTVFWETDAKGRLCLAAGFPDLRTGLPREKLFGHSYIELAGIPVQDAEHVGRILADMQARQAFRAVPVSIGSERGSRFLEVSGDPVFGSDGKFLGFRGFAQDVTDRRQREAALRTALAMAEADGTAKARLFAMASHELRTPLNALLGFAGLMRQESFGPIGNARYQGYVADIEAAGRHLLAIVDDLLDLAKGESGRFEFRDEAVDLAAVARDCLHLLGERAAQLRIHLDCEAPPDLPLCRADPVRLKQVLLNLLVNALDFTPEGGRIAITFAHESGQGLAVAIADTGVGIEPDRIPFLLEPFAQLPATAPHPRSGTGLGLPLAKALVEAQGGSFTIDSRPGQGTTIRLRFPPERLIPPPEILARTG
jgi:PAS domain S-box-containing protein